MKMKDSGLPEAVPVGCDGEVAPDGGRGHGLPEPVRVRKRPGEAAEKRQVREV